MTLGEMAVQVQALLDAGVPASARVSADGCDCIGFASRLRQVGDGVVVCRTEREGDEWDEFDRTGAVP